MANRGFRLREMRFTNSNGGSILIHIDDKARVVWSGQFDSQGRPIPYEKLKKTESLSIQIGEGKNAIVGTMYCRPDGHGGWICG